MQERKASVSMPDAPHKGHRERLRDRYDQTGADGFADYQLLELLLTYAIPRRDTNVIAHRLLDRFGSLTGVFRAETDRLSATEGIGGGAALFLHLLGDVYRRLSADALKGRGGKVALTSPLSAGRYALALMDGFGYETVLAVCLNSRREVLSRDVLQRGSLTEALVYPRTVAETALLKHAHSVLLIHNHPSGNPLPSPEDGVVTDAVRAALNSIGVQLADHLIVGDSFVYSFAAGVIMDIRGESVAMIAPEAFGAYRGEDAPPLKKVMEPYQTPVSTGSDTER